MLGRGYACIKDDASKKMNDSLAVYNMEKAIELGDTVTVTLNDIANIYKGGKNWTKLATTFEKMIAKSKRATAADYYNLSDAYMKSKDYVKADTALTKTIELYKDSWLVPYIIKARAKQYANPADSTFMAAPPYEKYIELIPEAEKAKDNTKRYLSEAYGYLGMKALLISKDTVKATEYMNQVLKYDPANTKAQQVLQSITGGTPAPAGTTPPPNNNQPNGGGAAGGQPRN
jgi:tetratricopeptide (TPR) repeat protein